MSEGIASLSFLPLAMSEDQEEPQPTRRSTRERKSVVRFAPGVQSSYQSKGNESRISKHLVQLALPRVSQMTGTFLMVEATALMKVMTKKKQRRKMVT